MTIASEVARNDYTGNGAASVYPFLFKIFSNTDLVVTKEDTAGVVTILTLSTDYTVTGAGNTAGGSITLTAGNLPASFLLNIRRVQSLTQDTDVRNQGDFFPDIHEDEFDILTMQDQTLQEQLNRSLKIPVTTTGVSVALPKPVASKWLRWNTTATAIELVDNADLSAIVSPMTTKGDLLTRNSSGYEKLAVGTDGQALVADTASTGGMKWFTIPTLAGANTFSAINTFSGGVQYAKGTNIASASSITLPTDGSLFDVTGTTTIAGIATNGVGTRVVLHFTGVLTLTASATLVLPNGNDITTVADDVCEFYEFAVGSWILINKSNDNTPVLANSTVALGTTFTVPVTTFANTGLAITLPADAGTYKVTAQVSCKSVVDIASAGSQTIMLRLYNATKAAALSGTEVTGTYVESHSAVTALTEYNTVTFGDTITTTTVGGETINVQAFYKLSTATHNLTEILKEADGFGASVISYERIG